HQGKRKKSPGGRHARPLQYRGQKGPVPRPTQWGPTTIGGHCPGIDLQSQIDFGRRTHRQPQLQTGKGNHGTFQSVEPGRSDHHSVDPLGAECTVRLEGHRVVGWEDGLNRQKSIKLLACLVNNTLIRRNFGCLFESHITSFKQPKIQEYIELHPLEIKNKVKFLEILSITSKSNPYQLVMSSHKFTS